MGEFRDIYVHNLKRIIERRKHTLKELADRIGVADVMLSRWVNGHHTPTEQYIEALAVALEVELIEFFRPVKARKITTLRDQTRTDARRKAERAAKGVTPRTPKKTKPKD